MSEPALNVKFEGFTHTMKQQAAILSIDEGKQIDCKDEQ
jgi:hypothetical protein